MVYRGRSTFIERSLCVGEDYLQNVHFISSWKAMNSWISEKPMKYASMLMAPLLKQTKTWNVQCIPR